MKADQAIRIVTLTTCHNRRACTLRALFDLHNQELQANIQMRHVLVDDGSIDGTKEAVVAKFPTVEIVSGDGNLYWAGGMRYGWNQSVSKKRYDYVLVYNDDVGFYKNAVSELVEASLAIFEKDQSPHVVVGSFLDPDGYGLTYGGRKKSSKWHPLKFATLVEPNGFVQEVDTLNMNAALLSASALARVGFLSKYFIHSGADFEYGLKLRKSGGHVYVARQAIGQCELNPLTCRSPEHAISIAEGIKQLFDIKREPPSQRFKYYLDHGGWLWPLYWVAPYITIWVRFFCKRLGLGK